MGNHHDLIVITTSRWSSHCHLVGALPTPLKKNEFASWDDYSIPNMMGKSFKIPWFQSPPTSHDHDHRMGHLVTFMILLSWVCLKIGYIPNYSHFIGIMISKTIG